METTEIRWCDLQALPTYVIPLDAAPWAVGLWHVHRVSIEGKFQPLLTDRGDVHDLVGRATLYRCSPEGPFILDSSRIHPLHFVLEMLYPLALR